MVDNTLAGWVVPGDAAAGTGQVSVSLCDRWAVGERSGESTLRAESVWGVGFYGDGVADSSSDLIHIPPAVHFEFHRLIAFEGNPVPKGLVGYVVRL